ncbi:DUF1961 family protein [Asticcacaulis sp. YBE204]|uniref:DUF1961 family protein n=1 Tax=Asticcacaulis sp. YBE204 TaxID=1282363 RepID=UPI0003C3B445|nr:DUF1961 family protein [Asticcacaulis sp. YBE204]ESQ78581.1 hypothetical protein AEYBE204_13605 [Asticcacaulis sp. YBE204]
MKLDRRIFLTGLAATGAASPLFAKEAGDLVYANPLKTPADVATFKMEGEAKVDFPNGRMQMSALRDAADGQASNFVFWCPEVFPDDIEISWDFRVLKEPGLCILFFAAAGVNGEHILDPKLKPRAGIYDQYTKSDVQALQISYFRRRWEEERAFHLANLRYAPGFELLAQGADPLPDVEDAKPPYRVKIRKSGATVAFTINDLPVVNWTGGPERKWPTKGSIGFRQMAPLVGEYENLEVRKLR